ncbi:TPA: GDP-mannose mannosyl hydrolase [Morganella morganii]|nr:GDP-mannose mannosyl hydrolase [Morganella morganii]
MEKLSDSDFLYLLKISPLISIDFIVKDSNNQVLLGYRTNEPAKNNWFVPGGRIFKNETINQAFYRLAKDELGIDSRCIEPSFHGVFEHLYHNSFYSSEVTTHYIVLAYVIQVDLNISQLPKGQHSNYRWFSIPELMDSPTVNVYTKKYFEEN